MATAILDADWEGSMAMRLLSPVMARGTLTLRCIEERFGESSSCSPASCSSSESSWSWLLVLGSNCILKAERADILLSSPVGGGVICWAGDCVLVRFNLVPVGWWNAML